MEFIALPIGPRFFERNKQLTQPICGPFQQPKFLKWKRPRDGYVVVNCDGSFRSFDDTGGYGVIIRDQYGLFIGAGAMCFPKSYLTLKNEQVEYGVTVLKIEMLAIRDGLRMSKNLKLTYVEIQSDSKIAISILRGYVDCPDECLDVYSDIIREAAYFLQLDFFFVYRETNQAADFLSKLLKSNGVTYLQSSSELPDQLRKICREDCMGKITLRF